MYCSKSMTRHAIEQAASRKVSMEAIVATVTDYDLLTKSDSEARNRKLYWKKVDEHVVVVVVGTDPARPSQVVSVYKASEGKRRAYARMMAEKAAV